MQDIFKKEQDIKEIIDRLKGLCATKGLSNQAEEERIISSVFLYKFLNDKFMYNLGLWAEEISYSIDDILSNKDGSLDAFYASNATDVSFDYESTIQYLVNKTTQQGFGKMFDDALVRISNSVKNEMFSVQTAEGTRQPLFKPITSVVEPSEQDSFAKAIFGIIAKDKFDFSGVFAGNFDFYSAIFEYLIKDYNVASGTYAEYFTPQSVSSIIAKCLVNMSDKIKAAEINDPAAGSGSLVLHLAHELGKEGEMNRAVVYTQDISNKSTRFLRLNLMLNGMSESLNHIIQGDTLLNPAHFEVEHDPSSGLKKFDYIVVNPPFKYDFSETRDAIENKWSKDTDRFFAGLPKIPAKSKDKMAIYLPFIQHVMYSLKADGKAAIVVPTGFITAQSGIEKAIRTKMVNERMLKGVISMPSNIFANTGTNVSVIFLDKANKEGDVLLLDASNMGTKTKDGKNQRTVLSEDEINAIIDTFINHKTVEDFSVSVSYKEIEEKNYSFSAGQYFKIKIEHYDITQEEFVKRIDSIIGSINENSERRHAFIMDLNNKIKDLII